NKQKLNDAVENRRKDAPSQTDALNAYNKAIEKATTQKEISDLQDGLDGKSVPGLPLILNLNEGTHIFGLTGKVDAKEAAIFGEQRKKVEKEIDKAKSTQDYRTLSDALAGMKVKGGLDATVAQLADGDKITLTITLNTKIAAFGKSVFDDARNRIDKSFTTSKSLEILKKYLNGAVTLDKVSPDFPDVFFLTDAQKASLKTDVAGKVDALARSEKAIAYFKEAIAAAATLDELYKWELHICYGVGKKPRADAPAVADLCKTGPFLNFCRDEVRPRKDALNEFNERLRDASTETDVAKVIEDIDKSPLFNTEMKKNLKSPAQKLKDDLKSGVESDGMQK
ncbi:MAG: hypothetical protein AAB288_12150, partial [Acidobacteriota bacterium]